MGRQVWGAAVLGLVIGSTTTSWTRGIEPQNGKGVSTEEREGTTQVALVRRAR